MIRTLFFLAMFSAAAYCDLFYANSAGASGTGDGSTEGNATTGILAITNNTANVNTLFAGLDPGDTVAIKSGTIVNYNGATGAYASITQPGSAALHIYLMGYQTTVGDTGRVVLHDLNLGATSSCMSFTEGYWEVRNIFFDSVRVAINATASKSVSCYNLYVNRPITNGINIPFGADLAPIVEGCTVVNSVAVGISVTGRSAKVDGCQVINAGTAGFIIGANPYGCSVTNSFAHSCGTYGFSIYGESTIKGCIANRNATGYYTNNDRHPVLFKNCGSTNNTNYGYAAATTTRVSMINCGDYGNGAFTNGLTFSVSYGRVTGDPLYVSENPTPETDVNLKLQSGSPWINTGKQ